MSTTHRETAVVTTGCHPVAVHVLQRRLVVVDHGQLMGGPSAAVQLIVNYRG